MAAADSSEFYKCPRCGSRVTKGELAESNYICRKCSLDVAYLELAPNGTVRAVVGWLQAVGTVLGDRYRITGILGKGGFAATYLVQDTKLKNKARALKEVPAAQHDEEETDLLSRLSHPAIPDITDRFELGGMQYLVLEFGGNRTLESERRSAGGTIPVPQLLPWMRELCEVLAYLHGQDPPIVHRDLKPDNILLDERDKIMLIDFGIAKEAGGFAVTRPLARSATHGFSPPEQVMSTGTDQRSDVYALGATMYALLTGKVPMAAHERVAGGELVPTHKLNPSIPPALDAAIMQALELNMNQRQQSISEFKEVLDSGGWTSRDDAPKLIGAGITVPVDPSALTPPTGPIGHLPPKKPAHGVGVSLAVVALAVLSGVGWWLYTAGPGDDQTTVDVTTPDQLPSATGLASNPVASGGGAAQRALETALAKPRKEATLPVPEIDVQAQPTKGRRIVVVPPPPTVKPKPRPTRANVAVVAPPPAPTLNWQILREDTKRID